MMELPRRYATPPWRGAGSRSSLAPSSQRASHAQVITRVPSLEYLQCGKHHRAPQCAQPDSGPSSRSDGPLGTPGRRLKRGRREEDSEGEGRIGKGERRGSSGRRVPFSAKSWGYSAFQYILPELTPKTNRCASRFAATAAALRASAAPAVRRGAAQMRRKRCFPH